MSRAIRAAGALGALMLILSGAACDKEEGLKIKGWEPKVGPHIGGGTVTITGTGFQSDGARGVNVYFGNKPAQSKFWIGDDKLKVTAPPGEIGETVDILLVFDDSKTHKIEKAYTYEDVQQGLSVDALTEGADAPGGAPPAGGAAPAGGTAPATP